MGNYQILKGQQKSAAQDDYIVFYIYRKISIYFSLLFIKLRLHPNMVNYFALIADLFVVYQIYLGNWITAGILVNLAIIFDCCDGEMARFYVKTGSKKKISFRYGQYLDEIVGFAGITMLVFFAGYFLKSPWVGLFAMWGLLMNGMSSFLALHLFKEEKKQVARDFEQGIFGKIKGRVGFSNGFQRILLTFAILFQSLWILLLFGIMINLLWILKIYLYRKL